MKISWPRLLLRQSPRTGRIIRESAEHYNEADHLADIRRISPVLEVEEGRVFHAFWRGTIAKGASVYFDQPITPGKKVRGLSLSALFSGGFLEFKQFVRADPGTILEALPGRNANHIVLNKLSENSFNRVDGLTGGDQIDSAFGVAPATGINSAVASISGAGTGGIYDSSNQTSFSAQNTSVAVDAEVDFNMIWVEEDILS